MLDGDKEWGEKQGIGELEDGRGMVGRKGTIHLNN